MKNKDKSKIPARGHEGGGRGHLHAGEDAAVIYHARASHAATLERMGEFRAAADAWGVSFDAAQDARSRFWCEVRQARCEKSAAELQRMPPRNCSIAAS